MGIPLNELQMYKGFDELAADILEMANEFMPDKLIFISTLTETEQIILKVLDSHISINVKEGMRVNLPETACNQMDFNRNTPLIFEDMTKEYQLGALQPLLLERNIHSYMGVPITLANGETFGTLCAVDKAASEFNVKSIKMFQRIAKMFAFYLELERKAYRDSLTGLYNREFLHRYFDDYKGGRGALFFLDLDGFKKVNDTYGHDAGDRLLKEVAHRLEEFMKPHSGIAARLGGDEFILLFPDLYDTEEMEKRAKSLLDGLSHTDTNLEKYKLSVSIGIARAGSSLDTLLKQADQALYWAKAEGKNTFRLY
ncbi:sensor domain-containing diguanylate cyclase [Bacillus sp. FJAT-42376]|uniref:sensor domain-containing diguanylate cyclase n=1 Tax=Bacillus sp. FJAT-42376 TaxID=2014076 RepID=UPI000F4F52A6|nr:sensor domain-containing diguanylate cyclase [Bacillus sp. FJAT-42376]AZB41761.1 sensor domain-containing diguanylate cyclase [Bacillus sp. FJAT-42376]